MKIGKVSNIRLKRHRQVHNASSTDRRVRTWTSMDDSHTTTDSPRSNVDYNWSYHVDRNIHLCENHSMGGQTQNGLLGSQSTNFSTGDPIVVAFEQFAVSVDDMVASFAKPTVLRPSGRGSDAPTSKVMATIKKDQYYNKFFGSDGDCYSHDQYKCAECVQSASEARAEASSAALSIIVSDNSASTFEKANAYHNFKKSTKYIRKALNMSDKQLNAKKMIEMPELMKQANQEVTIGVMDELLQEEHIPTGVTRNILNSFFSFIQGVKRKKR